MDAIKNVGNFCSRNVIYSILKAVLILINARCFKVIENCLLKKLPRLSFSRHKNHFQQALVHRDRASQNYLDSYSFLPILSRIRFIS